MIVIALCGLPGTGKSTLARELSERLTAPILDKDRVRQALFGQRFTLYSRAQDDHCMELLYQSAAWLAAQGQVPCAVIDGRTFLRAGQPERLVTFASTQSIGPRFVLCTAPRTEALRRLELDRESGAHPALNRTRAHFEDLERAARPIPYPHCSVDTHALSLEDQVRHVLAWLGL